MKKLLAGGLALLLVILSGCNKGDPRTALTAQEFSDLLEGSGYEVLNATNEFQEEGLESVLRVGVFNDAEERQLVFEYLAFPDESYCKRFYTLYSGRLQQQKGAFVQRNGPNYASYELVTQEEEYHLVSRTDSTMLFVYAVPEYEEEARGVVEQLGY